jgi:hypothetical protein
MRDRAKESHRPSTKDHCPNTSLWKTPSAPYVSYVPGLLDRILARFVAPASCYDQVPQLLWM